MANFSRMVRSFLLFLFVFLLAPVAGNAQKEKAQSIQPGSPLIGLWEFVPDSAEEAPSLLFENDNAGILAFNPGNAQSYGGLYMDTINGQPAVAGPSYFSATTDGKKIYGKLTRPIELDIPAGQEFEFSYLYNKTKDLLYITKNGKRYTYRRLAKIPW